MNFFQLIVTIAVPLEIKAPGDIIYAALLEANYVVPADQTEFEYPPIVSSTSSRSFLYSVMERKFEE